MEDLIIVKEDLANLDKWIQELPTKYGVSLLNFFSEARAKQTAKEAASQEAKEVPKNEKENKLTKT